jgi:hypothetical protein
LSRRQATSNPKSQSSRQKATLAENAANESVSSSPAAAAQQGGSSSFRSFLPHNMNVFLNQPRTVPVPRWVSPRHYSTTLSESFGHASFILVAASYAVDDFLQLRIIAVAGSTAMLVFTYFHPHGRVLWLPFKWNLLFIAINGYRIGKVYLDQWRAQSMSGDMRRIHDQHFYVMKLVDFSRLVRMGEKITVLRGQELIHQGDPNKYIYLVLGGELDVLRDGMITYKLTEG